MINLEWNKWLQLQKKGYGLDLIYLLLNLENYDSKDFENPKIPILFQTLIRKGLATNEGKATVEGNSIIEFLSTNEETKLVKKKVLSKDDFDLFWEAFPRTDAFEHKGKKFSRTRTLRQDPEGCRTKLKSILNTGEYKIDDIVKALKYDVFSRKENSYKTGQNKLTFMQNSKTYLNQLSFDSLIEESKGFEIKEKEEYNGVDI